MEIKKSPKANLENKKGLYFEIGLAIALGILFLAFEYKTDNSEVSEIEDTVQAASEEEIITVTQHNTPPPPPPPPAPKLTDLIDIVESEQDVDEELELLDAEEDVENTDVNFSEFGEYGATDTGENEIFTVVEQNPGFKGDLNKWLTQNLRYPQIASENGTQGRVIVQFVVEKDGSITDVKVVRGVDEYLDKEAIRVVSAMPKWSPGMQRNKPVRVAFTLPVTFRLQ